MLFADNLPTLVKRQHLLGKKPWAKETITKTHKRILIFLFLFFVSSFSFLSLLSISHLFTKSILSLLFLSYLSLFYLSPTYLLFLSHLAAISPLSSFSLSLSLSLSLSHTHTQQLALNLYVYLSIYLSVFVNPSLSSICLSSFFSFFGPKKQ